jgi:malate synthase
MKPNLLKYLPYGLILVAFILGQLSAPGSDKELIKRFADEKKALLNEREYLQAHIATLSRVGLLNRKKLEEDSLKYSVALKAKDEEIKRLLKHIKNVNTAHYSAADLDSAIQRLYPND